MPYRGGKRVRTGVEELLREERLVLRALLYSMLGTPSSKPRSWRWGDFKYVIVDGKYVKLRGGRKGCSRSRWDSRRTV